ncbi:MAG: C1 family peptidase, partial [Ramlibacter sp.]
RRGAAGAKAAAAAGKVGRTRNTRRDPPDLRDRLYQPQPIPLPDQYPPESDVHSRFKDYAGMVLDQGQEGSCTGYGLACCINFARWAKSDWSPKMERVSPRMLYNFARRYDEYAGEDYEGSSCRGALKGWFNHGVCSEVDWPERSRPKYGYAQRATKVTLGVYYRIDIKSITDMQAAIMQTHAIFVSAFTHEGWEKMDTSPALKGVPSHKDLPLIEFDGRASMAGGHAFALVGFNSRGFIVQNSWGASFGLGGFAVMSYADWLTNGMDAWVASLGVPDVVQGRLAAAAQGSGAVAQAGSGPWQARWWDEPTAYRHSIVTGDDGRVTNYLTQDELSRSLLYQACALPDQWFRTDPVASQSPVKRLVIYAHGGLNSEKDAIKRARAMGRYFTGNGCYPLFLVWKTGLFESLGNIMAAEMRNAPQIAGGAFDKVFEATDKFIEKTIGRGPARQVWTEMKQNAEFSCTTNRGGDLLASALQNLAASWGPALEIHLVAHSAGSILLGHLLEVLSARQVANGPTAQRKLSDHIATAHLFAPACTVQFANRHYAPNDALMKKLWLHILKDEQERDDSVAAIYRKSLLYLVSDALEPDLRTPILGLENVRKSTYAGWDGSSTTTEALGSWRDAVRATDLDQRTTVVADPRVPQWKPGKGAAELIAASHGSFDNNVEVISTTLERITGGKLKVPVDDLRGF